MRQSYTSSHTYSVADIEIVMRRVTADLVMIASSTGAISEETARKWGHDIELLARHGYLKKVDLTLLSYGVEQVATEFTVDTDSGDLKTSRPGGVMWPRVAGADLRIVIFYTDKYDAAAKEKMRNQLKIPWSPTSVDTSHASLKVNANRNYVSNSYGMQRKDYSK